jgi:asparagine synthase (glutamine-hydrolysing)
MCGICGAVSLREGGIDADLLDCANATLVHRGPDSGGSFVDGVVGLAARRLAIIDLAGGDQPLANEDATVHVVQNGEIYNHRELRADLERRGHRFRTRSDTEVLAHMYEEHGPGFVEQLRGMFAIALWDARARRLVLARDRFGIKPLYYWQSPEGLSFASELKALTADPAFPRDVDLDALEAFLAFACIPAPLTIFQAARKLPAGCLLVWEHGAGGGEPRIERYARPTAAAADTLRCEDERELVAELRDRLRDSVRAHLIADVPVGVLLSGGIDSSLLTALAAQESGERVRTFSIGFDERRFDERDNARLVAQRYDTDHHELVVRPDAAELLPLLADVYDEPFADSSAIPTFLVSGLARSQVKVALSGEGGDELFGGYFNYVGHRLAPVLGRPASAMRPLIERLPASSGAASTLDYKAKHFARGARRAPLERHFVWKSILSPAQRAAVLAPGRRGAVDPLELLRPSFAASAGAEPLARMMDLDLSVFLVEDMLVKTDRASMAQSLELRVPFLDPVVADFALALPSRHKVRGLGKKRLLRKAAAGLVPDEIVGGAKHGFSVPIAAWLRGELEPFARDVLAADTIRRQGFLRSEAVTEMIDAHVAGRRDNSRQIWCLLAFSLWHDRYGGAAAG